jgi:hypothetical protein
MGRISAVPMSIPWSQAENRENSTLLDTVAKEPGCPPRPTRDGIRRIGRAVSRQGAKPAKKARRPIPERDHRSWPSRRDKGQGSGGLPRSHEVPPLRLPLRALRLRARRISTDRPAPSPESFLQHPVPWLQSQKSSNFLENLYSAMSHGVVSRNVANSGIGAFKKLQTRYILLVEGSATQR